jgi:hypothetical protein
MIEQNISKRIFHEISEWLTRYFSQRKKKWHGMIQSSGET